MYISSFCSRQDLCSDHTEHTVKPHYPRGGARDAVRLSIKPKHSRHDILPTTTPGKVHRAGSTPVYGLSRLPEGIQHRWEDWTMASAEEIWMPRKVHNHDRKFAYRNDGEQSLHAIMTECRPLYSSTLQSEDKNHKYTYERMLFADDITLIAHSAEEIQMIVYAFANASSKFGLKNNIKKREVMFKQNSTTTMEEDINIDETTLNPVKEFP